MISENEYTIWYDKIRDKHSNISWIKIIYWYLEEYSCIHIKRNSLWFQSALPYFTETWQTIQKEKKTGYLHRQPKKRIKKPKEKENLLFSIETIETL